MTYKTYKITKITKGNIQNYIKFELDDYVEFSNGNHNFVFCVNQYQFTSYQVGDKIEVDLTNAKRMSSRSYHQEIIRKTSRSYAGEYYDDYIPQSDSNRDPQKILTQSSITLSAYETEVVYDFLYNALEWLELYIEKANYYPDWQQKKQLPKTITRPDIPYLDAKETREHFLTLLSGLKAISIGKPPFLLEKLQTEFFSWLDSSGIDVNSCPTELTQSLVDFHSILIGKAGEFTKRRRKEVDENIAKMTSEEKQRNFHEVIAAYQEPLENEDKVFEAMKGQTYKDVNNEGKFSGDNDRGKEKFELIKRQPEISQREASRQQELEYLNRGDEMETDELASSSSPVVSSTNQVIRQEIVNDIKQRIDGFKIEKFFVPNGVGGFDQEDWIVHDSAERSSDESGGLIFDSKNMYKVKDLTELEKQEIGYNKSEKSLGCNSYSQLDKNPKSNNLPTNLIIGGTVLAIIGLISFLIIKKHRKNK